MKIATSPARLLIASILTTFLLAGCGGSGDELLPDASATPDNTGSTPTPGTSNTIDVTISVSGLKGNLNLSVGSDARVFTSDSSLRFIGVANDGSVSASITAIPASQECYFSNNQALSTAISASLQIQCYSLLSFSITANIYGDTGVVNNATVVLQLITGATVESIPFTATGADGIYLLEDFILSTAPDRMQVLITAAGYISNTLPVEISGSNLNIERTVDLVPLSASANFDPSTENTFTLEGADILVPANALTDSSGQPPSGNVDVVFSNLDPSPAPEILPGNYSIQGGSGDSYFESFGAFHIQFVDGSGNELEIAEGAQVTVTVPVAARAQANPPSAPNAYYFDLVDGYWHDSSNTFTLDGGAGTYDVAVDRTGTWTSGEVYTHVFIGGCVVDRNGAPVADATIIAQGQSYIGRTVDFSNASGRYSVPAKANSTVLVFSRGDYSSRVFSISVGSTNTSSDTCLLVDPDTSTITLSWGSEPSDLDSHLIGPTGFHIDYTNKEAVVGDTTIYLDIDDVSSFGPEVITLPKYPLEGTYSYYVHLFTGTGSIYTSPARVALFTDREEYIFNPTSPDLTDCWHVFDIQVSASGSGLVPSVTTADEWVDTSFCHQ